MLAPPDYQQGDGFRIIYVHAPSAWMSLMVYTTMAMRGRRGADLAHQGRARGGGQLRADRRLLHAARRWSPAALWGQPMWGTYWEWDPRLTSELMLLFLYLGYMGLRAGLEDTQRADRASARAGDRRRGQRADHSLLGDLVELAAPGALGDAARPSPTMPAVDAGAAADDAARLHAVLRGACCWCGCAARC